MLWSTTYPEKRISKFGEHGHAAGKKEVKQLHDRKYFVPIDLGKLSIREKQRAMGALMFLTKKKINEIKGRVVYNGKPTRGWLINEEARSPTAALDSITLTSTVDAH